MPNKLDLSGQVFGSLTVLREDGKDNHGAYYWVCQCACGKESRVRGAQIKSGVSRSCGCGVKIAAQRPRTHGMTKYPIYSRWRAMLDRCGRAEHDDFHNYGGRGIKICERWKQFENFFADMGGGFSVDLELDRIDVNGNYEPSNCRWATRKEQQRNRRNNHVLAIGDKSKTLAEWEEDTGVKANTILTRVRRGWPENRLLEMANR